MNETMMSAEHWNHPQMRERELNATRAEMDRNSSGFGKKLSPRRLVDAWSFMTEQSCALSGNLRDMVKRYPMPALVTAVGVGWWVLSAKTANDGAEFDYDTGKPVRALTDIESDFGNESVHERASAVARRTMTKAQEKSDDLRDALRSMAYEQPLMLGAIGILIGAALGAFLPATDPEQRWFGATRDETLDRLKQRSKEAYEQVRDTAAREVNEVKKAVSEIVGK